MNFYSVGSVRYVDESVKELQNRLRSLPKTLVIYCITYSAVTCVLFSIHQVSASHTNVSAVKLRPSSSFASLHTVRFQTYIKDSFWGGGGGRF